ncbi:MAG: glycerol-3-phosphate acyltransferase [Oscillospiraceae bacterium]
MIKLVVCLLLIMMISYLLGSCNSANIVVCCLMGEDIREHGSMNAGSSGAAARKYYFRALQN